MDYAFIIGTLLTILFGIPSLINWLREKAPKIYFTIEEEFNLYKSISRDVAELDINYKGQTISNKAQLLRAFFVYKGSKDVNKSQIDKPLYIDIPKNSQWLDYKILQTSKDFEVSTRLVEERLYFDFNLLKDGDFIYFKCLVNPPEDSKNIFSYGHRIENIGNITRATFESTKPTYPFIMSLVFILTTLIAFIYTSYDYKSSIIDLDSKYVDYQVYSHGNIVNTDSLYYLLDNSQNMAIRYMNSVLKSNSTLDTSLVKKTENLESFTRNFLSVRKSVLIFLKHRLDSSSLTIDIDTNKLYKINEDFSVKFKLKNEHFWFNLLIMAFLFVSTVATSVEFYIKYRKSVEMFKVVEAIKQQSLLDTSP